MDEYVCMTVRSRPGEGADEFHKRLIVFWSHVLRSRKDEYDQVYAETTRFEIAGVAVQISVPVLAFVALRADRELRARPGPT